MKTKFQPHERLMLKVGEGWIIRQQRLNHLTTRVVMKHSHQGETDVPEQALTKLVSLGWLRAVPHDALWDSISYEVTSVGQQALTRLWEAEGEKR